MSFLIIDRLDQFVYSAVKTAIVFVVALIILRLISNRANWNFFGWPAVTTRRLTDPLIGPVRRALIGFRVDPKYAPLVAILITLLLAFLVVRVTDSVLGTIAGVMSAVQQQSVARIIGHLLYGLLGLYILLIFVRIVFSWITVSRSNRVMRFLVDATEPLLGPLRRVIPPVGMFDISPFVAFIIVWLCQTAVAGTLLR
jgi:YggT family protein